MTEEKDEHIVLVPDDDPDQSLGRVFLIAGIAVVVSLVGSIVVEQAAVALSR